MQKSYKLRAHPGLAQPQRPARAATLTGLAAGSASIVGRSARLRARDKADFSNVPALLKKNPIAAWTGHWARSRETSSPATSP